MGAPPWGSNSGALPAPDRFARIECQLNDMQKVLVELAKMKERETARDNLTTHLVERLDKSESRTGELQEQLADLSKTVENNGRTANAVERIGWLVVSSVFAVAGYGINRWISNH